MTQKLDMKGIHPGRSSGPFMILPENQLAFEGIKQLQAAGQSTSQCLLYLTSPSGTGKTHLVKHCLKEFLRENENMNYQNLLVSEYAARYAEASQNKTPEKFQKQFENCQLLILEDLTAIQGRKETQKQLVSTIDHVLKNGGKCILTCTKMPGELESVSTRLTNRCHGGICLEMELPGKKSREKLLHQMASFMQIPLPNDAIKLIATSVSASPRELEATLIQLEATAQMNKKNINMEFIKLFLAGDISTPSPTLTQITRSVSKQFQVSIKNIRSTSRLQGHVFARQCAMFLMRELREESLQKIAAYFHRKNHSTVTHACRKIHKMETDNITMKHHLKQIRNSLGVLHR